MHTLAKESTHAMEIEDIQMEIQSHLCQLKVENLGVIAKTLGCGDSDIKDKTRKGLVRLIEEHLEAKLKGSVEPDTDRVFGRFQDWNNDLHTLVSTARGCKQKIEVGSLSIGTWNIR